MTLANWGGELFVIAKKNFINKAKGGFNFNKIAFQRVSTECSQKTLSGKDNLEHFGEHKNRIVNIFNTGVLISY